MKKSIAIILAVMLSACAMAGEPVYQTQIQMRVPPTQPKHVTTKEYVDEVGLNVVKYDEEGNVPLAAGTKIQVVIPNQGGDPIVRGLLDTDNAGNFIIGHPDSEINMQASLRPTVAVAGATEQHIVLESDIADLATQHDVDEALARKADLVDGVLPTSQLPPGIISQLWSVATQADLVTLTDARVNDDAYTTDTGDLYKLIGTPPTNLTNWKNITSGGGGGGGGAVDSVNGMTGAVLLDLQNFPAVQNALDDKANASDLAAKANIASPTFTGIVRAPTPATTSNDTAVATSAFVNTRLGNYLPLTGGTLTGTLSANIYSYEAALSLNNTGPNGTFINIGTATIQATNSGGIISVAAAGQNHAWVKRGAGGYYTPMASLDATGDLSLYDANGADPIQVRGSLQSLGNRVTNLEGRITYGTTAMNPGVSALATGAVYFQYE